MGGVRPRCLRAERDVKSPFRSVAPRAALVVGALAAVVLLPAPAALAAYPPPPAEDAEPIPPAPEPAPLPPAPAPRPVPQPDPEPTEDPDDPTPEPDPLPTPDPAPDPLPAPDPSPEAPEVEPGGGTGERDGEPIDIRVRPAPDPDDPVLGRVPGITLTPEGTVRGLPARDDGTPREPDAEQVVAVEAGPLALVVVGETCGGDLMDLDASGALRTTPGGALVLGGGGFQGDAEAEAWLYSDPTFLVTEVTAPDGSLGLVATVPGDHPVGRHVAQLTGTGVDGAAYRVSLDVDITACDAGTGLLGLPALADLAGRLGLLLLGLLLGLLLCRFRWIPVWWRSLRIRLIALPGAVPVRVRTRAVASRGRRTTDAEVRGGWSGLDPRDRALVATDLVLDASRVLDLDGLPVPSSCVVVVEAAGVTWVLAVRRPDGGHEPVVEGDVLRLVPGGTVVMVLDGVRRGGRIEVSLGSLSEDEDADDDRVLDTEVLGHLRGDTAGRARGEVPLPDDLGTLPLVLGLRMRGR